jgi:transposase
MDEYNKYLYSERGKKEECETCGEEIRQRAGKKQRRYCSDACRYAYWNKHRNERERKWRQKTECKNCGEEIRSYGERKYCSQACYIEYRYKKEPRGEGKGKEEEKAKTEIAKIMKEMTREKERSQRGRWGRYRRARTAEEWRARLGEERKEAMGERGLGAMEGGGEGKRVYMVCGGMRVSKGIDSLGGIIQARLGMNPFDGSTYAFCNRGCDQIKYIKWDGSGFMVSTKRIEYGRIPWAGANLGKYIRVSEGEFEYLLTGGMPKEYAIGQDFSEKIMI